MPEERLKLYGTAEQLEAYRPLFGDSVDYVINERLPTEGRRMKLSEMLEEFEKGCSNTQAHDQGAEYCPQCVRALVDVLKFNQEDFTQELPITKDGLLSSRNYWREAAHKLSHNSVTLRALRISIKSYMKDLGIPCTAPEDLHIVDLFEKHLMKPIYERIDQ